MLAARTFFIHNPFTVPKQHLPFQRQWTTRSSSTTRRRSQLPPLELMPMEQRPQPLTERLLQMQTETKRRALQFRVAPVHSHVIGGVEHRVAESQSPKRSHQTAPSTFAQEVGRPTSTFRRYYTSPDLTFEASSWSESARRRTTCLFRVFLACICAQI